MNIKKIIRRNGMEIVLGVFIFIYIAYFSWFTVLRYQTLWAHYFDLGIMHQTVYNTFMSLKTGDFSRFLELTNPHGFDQVKRMAIHNDIFLSLLTPFYFIYSGPETLLVIQAVAVGLGALALYGIGLQVFEKIKHTKYISLFFAWAYLMNPALQRANQFDFHAVVLATPLLLFMYYFYLKKNFFASFICAAAVLLTKEQVGLTIAFFGLFIFLQTALPRFFAKKKKNNKVTNEYIFASALLVAGSVWFYLSMNYIIPTFRQGAHFALTYFGDFGDSPSNVFVGLLKNPLLIFQYIFRRDTYEYLFNVLGPVGFLSLISPLHLLIVAPEFAINLLSKSGGMRNIFFHYTAVITPFIMISALYGFELIAKRISWKLIIIPLGCVIGFSYLLSPLPYSRIKELNPLTTPALERFDAYKWQEKLKDDSIRVMATGHIAPLFASRRYVYNLSSRYDLADYVVLSIDEVYNSGDSTVWIPAYETLIKDKRFTQIYKNGNFEVYKKI